MNPNLPLRRNALSSAVEHADTIVSILADILAAREHTPSPHQRIFGNTKRKDPYQLGWNSLRENRR